MVNAGYLPDLISPLKGQHPLLIFFLLNQLKKQKVYTSAQLRLAAQVKSNKKTVFRGFSPPSTHKPKKWFQTTIICFQDISFLNKLFHNAQPVKPAHFCNPGTQNFEQRYKGVSEVNVFAFSIEIFYPRAENHLTSGS